MVHVNFMNNKGKKIQLLFLLEAITLATSYSAKLLFHLYGEHSWKLRLNATSSHYVYTKWLAI